MNKKNLISLLVLAILIVAVPLGLNLARQQQVLKSRAAENPITFSGDNAEQRSGTWVVKDRTKPITVTFTSPLGPPAVGVGSTGPHILQSVSSPIKGIMSLLPQGLVGTVYAGHDNGCGATNSCPEKEYCDLTYNVLCNDQKDGTHQCTQNPCGQRNDQCNPPGAPSGECITKRCLNGNPCAAGHKYCRYGDAGNYWSECIQEVDNCAQQCSTGGGGQCNCSSTWEDVGCGRSNSAKSCAATEMLQIRACPGTSCTTNDTVQCVPRSSCGSTGGGSCSIAGWSLQPDPPVPGTNFRAFIKGGSSTNNNWGDIGLKFDGNAVNIQDIKTDGSLGTFNCSSAQPCFGSTTLRSDSAGSSHTLIFSTRGGTVCSNPKTFNTGTAPTTPPQSCSTSGDFNGDGRTDLADYDIWEPAFRVGREICPGVATDLVLFNTWKRKSERL